MAPLFDRLQARHTNRPLSSLWPWYINFSVSRSLLRFVRCPFCPDRSARSLWYGHFCVQVGREAARPNDAELQRCLPRLLTRVHVHIAAVARVAQQLGVIEDDGGSTSGSSDEGWQEVSGDGGASSSLSRKAPRLCQRSLRTSTRCCRVVCGNRPKQREQERGRERERVRRERRCDLHSAP